MHFVQDICQQDANEEKETDFLENGFQFDRVVIMLMVLVGKTSSTPVLSENARKAIESQVDSSSSMNNASRL